MKRPFLSALLLLAVACPSPRSSTKTPEETPKDAVIKRDETVKPEGRYANMPDEAVPYRRFTKPYYDWFMRDDTLQYHGAADLRPDGDPAELSEIAIGFMSPIENNPEIRFRPAGAPRRAIGPRTGQRARADTKASLTRSRSTTNRPCGELPPPNW